MFFCEILWYKYDHRLRENIKEGTEMGMRVYFNDNIMLSQEEIDKLIKKMEEEKEQKSWFLLFFFIIYKSFTQEFFLSRGIGDPSSI